MRLRAVKRYLEQQAAHHGYGNRVFPPVYRYRSARPAVLSVAHAVFDLKHHLVLGTKFRSGIFHSVVGEALANYWIQVAAHRDLAIDQMTVLPDHVHLIVRITPKMTIEECTLLLMNNGQYFVGKHYPQLLIEAGLDQLWQSSGYAGTCGELPTSLLKAFLQGE